MLFITAGMGGGTGTGATPIVAQVAKELGILTVAVVTKPFEMEGVKRLTIAEQGIGELGKYVDSLITIPNEKLYCRSSAAKQRCWMRSAQPTRCCKARCRVLQSSLPARA